MKVQSTIPKAFISMKKIWLFLAFGLVAHLTAWAQPTIIFPVGSVSTTGETCVDVKVIDFTDILSMDITIQWDPAIISFSQVSGFVLEDLDAGDFDLSNAANGSIRLNWSNLVNGNPQNCSQSGTVGVTLDDMMGANPQTIFQICFTSTGAYGGLTSIGFDPNITPHVTRVNTACNNIGAFSQNGLLAVDVRPLTVKVSDETGNAGDLVCVDVAVSGFDAMRTMQFSLNWDPNVLQIQSVIPNDNIPGNGIGRYGFNQPPNLPNGVMTISWDYFIPGEPPVTLPDGTVFFQACFLITGPCESATAIQITGNPTPVEVTNEVEAGFSIPTSFQSGSIIANDCTPTGLQLVADCGAPVQINDEFCVDINVGNNYQNITDLSCLINWNTNLIEFVSVQPVAPTWGVGDFITNNTANGILGVDYEISAGQNRTPGSTLFRVCFKVIGLGGDAPIFITTPAIARVNNGPNIGINPSNCAVNIIQPPGVALSVSDAAAEPNGEACVDVSVANFEEITNFQFSMAWDNIANFNFIDIRDINIPGGSLANFNTGGSGSGSLFFDWDAPGGTPVTLPDDQVIFRVCLQPVGPPQTCDDFLIVDFPLITEAISAGSNGENIGIISSNGEVCTLFPEGYGVIIPEIEGDRQDTVCIPIKVASFDNIVSTNFSINWDPSSLEFINYNNTGAWPGLTAANITDNTPVGLLTVNWNGGSPTAIPDSTTVLELCFKLIGPVKDCYPVAVNETPAATVQTANGQGSLIADNGEICINDKFIIEDVIITPASCPDACDAKVELVVSGGEGFVGTTWLTQPQIFTPLMAQNLCPGTVNFRLFDTSNPVLIDEFSVEVPVTTDLPVALANDGMDEILGCNPPTVLLNGSGSDEATHSYQWYYIANNQKIALGQGTKNVVAVTTGPHILEVTRDSTGCTVADTIMVTPPVLPEADAGTDQDFTCQSETVQLTGSGSNDQPVSYLWTPIGSGAIVPGEETTLTPNVTEPGMYQLQVKYTVTQCVALDTVVIDDVRIIPSAQAVESEKLLDCIGTPADFEADVFNNDGLNVTYEWYDNQNNLVGNGTSFSTTTLGEYYLIVTEQTSNCMAMDTVYANPNADYPEVNLAEADDITCMLSEVGLSATVAPEVTSFTVNWTAANGGSLQPGTEMSLTPVALSAGDYTVAVTNVDNSCTTEMTLTVGENMDTPNAEAGEAATLTCTQGTASLSGAGSSEGAFDYEWTDEDGMVVGTALETTVSSAGKYFLKVTDQVNGCFKIDSVMVDAPANLPDVSLAITSRTLTCDSTTVTESAAVSNLAPEFTILWTASNGGHIVGAADQLSITADMAGTYTLTVTNPANECSGTAELIVDENMTAPAAEAGPATVDLTCLAPTVTLDASASTAGVTVEWSDIPAPDNTQPMVDVTAPGIYTLTVTDPNNGCTATDQIEVKANNEAPEVTFGTVDAIDCANGQVTLNPTITTAGTDLAITWTGLDGGTPTPNNAAQTTVTTGGKYEILVVNNLTGCESKDTVTVEDLQDPPVIQFVTPESFKCSSSTVSIDASGTGNTADFSSIVWTTADGGTITPATGSLNVSVSAAGTYTLTVKRADNGCEATQQVVVAADQDTPVANAGADVDLNCGQTGTLDGSQSTSQFTIQWTGLNGAANPTPATSLTPTISAAGTYLLTISNTANGCVDKDTVVVSLLLPPAANAGADQSICGDMALLSANLPTGTTGAWTTSGSATLGSASANETDASDLEGGDNKFVWTLSAPGCPDYSSDEMSVVVEEAPAAFDDILTIPADKRTGAVNLVVNDVLTNAGQWEVTLLNQPEIGVVDSLKNGQLFFSVPRGASGQVVLNYEICNLDCPDLCATAKVTISINNDGFVPETPNTITPNGDGLNDFFVFDDLITSTPDQFPDNELIIFNRWGDIVYQAKPYHNDWDGVGESGQELPQGTYYYILRLNIAEGVIYRGDITIVK